MSVPEEHIESLLPEGFEEQPEDSLDAEPEAAQEEEPQQEQAVEAQEESRANQRIRQLIEERNELKERMDQQAQGMLTLKEAVEKLAETRQQEPENKVDFMEDPQGYVDQQTGDLKAQLEELQEQAKGGNEDAQRQLAQMQFVNALQTDEMQFHNQNQDYYQALDYIRGIKSEQYAELGMNEEQIAQRINAEETTEAMVAMQNGKSPAEYAYNNAKRLGYAGAEKPAEGQEELDEQVKRMENLQNAQSMGGSGVPEGAQIDTAEEEAWAPVEEAFRELFGQELS